MVRHVGENLLTIAVPSPLFFHFMRGPPNPIAASPAPHTYKLNQASELVKHPSALQQHMSVIQSTIVLKPNTH